MHSLHAYFLRPGDPAVPIVYQVDRVRDGRSFTTRRVSAVQHGEPIFTLSASFHHPEPGPEHQTRCRTSRRPEALPSGLGPAGAGCCGPRLVARYREHARSTCGRRADAGRGGRDPSPRTASEPQVWLRADGDLPDDPLLHVVPDDLRVGHDAARHGAARRTAWPGWTAATSGASLDHAMWFHRPFRADEWLLYAQDSPVASGARGLARGEVFTAGGELVVSVVQEGLIRSRPRSAEPGSRSLKSQVKKVLPPIGGNP